jgi:urease accessory protein
MPATTPNAEAAPAASDPVRLVRLLTWLSPAFPIGGFAYSHGLETAVATGLVTTAEDLAAWIATLIAHGSARADALLLCHAWRAEQTDDETLAAAVASLADASRATAELALEAHAQGEAFLAAVAAGWPDPAFDRYRALLGRIDRPPAHACVVGVAAAAAGIALEAAVAAWLQAFAAGLVAAGVKLIPLGQRDGLRVQAGLEPAILAAARRAPSLSLAEIGTATWVADWTSAAHETQYTRLFRS